MLLQQQRSDRWPLEISITNSQKTYPISILLLLQKFTISLNSYLKFLDFCTFWDANNIFLIQYQLHIAHGLFAQLWPKKCPSDYFSPLGHETALKCKFLFSFILFIPCLLLSYIIFKILTKEMFIKSCISTWPQQCARTQILILFHLWHSFLDYLQNSKKLEQVSCELKIFQKGNSFIKSQVSMT